MVLQADSDQPVPAVARILVIDDDPDVRAAVLEVLESAGHEVQLASDGVQGLLLQRQRPVALVITDLFMPEKEGLETIDDLKREYPETKIIAMSGGGPSFKNAGYLEVASKLGAHLILNKPFAAKTLLESVQKVLKLPPG